MQHGAALDVVILNWRFSRRSSACPRKSTAAIHPPTTHPMRKPSYAINCLLYTSDDRVHGSGVGKPWAWVESASSIIEASPPSCISCCRHARAMEATRETIDSGASEAVPASAVLATDQGGARSHGSLTVPHGLLLREKDGTESTDRAFTQQRQTLTVYLYMCTLYR
jgi:hypothetical protein